MPRPRRFLVEGSTYHVIQRGTNRCETFHDARDHAVFQIALRELSEEHRVAIHGFVQMTTHVHLLSTPATRLGLPKMMQALGDCYVQYFNKRHERIGTLWAGRYRSFPIDSEAYFLTCLRYVEQNPVRAGMVANAGDYLWSSYRANAWGIGSKWLQPHWIFQALGSNDAERRAAYRALCGECLSDSDLTTIRDACHTGWPLGRPAFHDALEKHCARSTRRRRSGPIPAGGRVKVDCDAVSARL